jgi:hypothetical protein
MSESQELPIDSVYFGRIDPRWNDKTREEFWRLQRFAVMFDNDGTVDPSGLARARELQKNKLADWYTAAGYSSQYGVEALERMMQAIEDRALVFVDFRGRKGNTVMIGRAVGPLEIVEVEETYARGSREGILGTSRYKTMRLDSPRILNLDPVLAALRPQQATFTRWPSAAPRVAATYHGLAMPTDVSSLTPGQVEALCYEHLRRCYPEMKLLLPVGRTLPDIDVYGWLPGGQRLTAQVTHRTSPPAVVLGKARQLAKVEGAARRILFAGAESLARTRGELHKVAPEVHLIAVEEVFSEAMASDSSFVKAMLGGPM